MKRFISTLMILTVLASVLTACGKVENPYKNSDKTESSDFSVRATESTTTDTTLSPEEISRQAEQRSRDAIAKAKYEASSRAASQLAEKGKGTYNTQKSAFSGSSASVKTTAKRVSSTVRSPYDSSIDYVTVPAAYKSGFQRAWLVKKFSGLDIRIARIEYGSVTQHFDSSYNSSVVNPKNVTYRPACTIAVIKTDSPSRLNVLTSAQHSTTEALAKRAGAVIAINGRNSSNEQSDAAVIRSGSLYKKFTGTKAKHPQLIMFKDGHWEFRPLDNEAAENAIKKGAYNSVSFQDITIQNGTVTAGFADSPYHNRTFIGQVNKNRYIFMTTECMPVKDAARIMLAYGVQNAVQIGGGNCTYMYLNSVGNTTGSDAPAIKGLNKLGYLESEWLAQKGLYKQGKNGSPCANETDCIYFK